MITDRPQESWKITQMDERICATEESLSRVTPAVDKLLSRFEHQVSRINRIEEEVQKMSLDGPRMINEMLDPLTDQIEEMRSHIRDLAAPVAAQIREMEVNIKMLEETKMNMKDFSIGLNRALETEKSDVIDIVDSKIQALDTALREFFEKLSAESSRRGVEGAAAKFLQVRRSEKDSDKKSDSLSRLSSDSKPSSPVLQSPLPSGSSAHDLQEDVLPSKSQTYQDSSVSDSQQSVDLSMSKTPEVPLMSDSQKSFLPSELQSPQVSSASDSQKSDLSPETYESEEVVRLTQKDASHGMRAVMPRGFASDLNQRFGDVWEEISRLSDMISNVSVDEEMQAKAVDLERMIRKLNDTIEVMHKRIDYLGTELKLRDEKVEWMHDCLEELKNEKIDRNEFEDMLLLKANRRDLDDKVDKLDFESNLEEICETVRRSVEKVAKVGQEFETTREEVYFKLEKKLNIDDHEASLKPLWNRIRSLMHSFGKIKSVILTSLYPDSGAVTKCMCCGRLAELAGMNPMEESSVGPQRKAPRDSYGVNDVQPVDSRGKPSPPSALSFPEGSVQGTTKPFSSTKSQVIPRTGSRYMVKKIMQSSTESYGASIDVIAPQLDRVLEVCERTMKLKFAINSPCIESAANIPHPKEGSGSGNIQKDNIGVVGKERAASNLRGRVSFALHQPGHNLAASGTRKESQSKRKISLGIDERKIRPINTGMSGPGSKIDAMKKFSTSQGKSVDSKSKIVKAAVISIPFDVQLKDGSIHHPDIVDTCEELMNRVQEHSDIFPSPSDMLKKDL